MKRTQPDHLFAFFGKAEMFRDDINDIVSLLNPAD